MTFIIFLGVATWPSLWFRDKKKGFFWSQGCDYSTDGPRESRVFPKVPKRLQITSEVWSIGSTYSPELGTKVMLKWFQICWLQYGCCTVPLAYSSEGQGNVGEGNPQRSHLVISLRIMISQCNSYKHLPTNAGCCPQSMLLQGQGSGLNSLASLATFPGPTLD